MVFTLRPVYSCVLLFTHTNSPSPTLVFSLSAFLSWQTNKPVINCWKQGMVINHRRRDCFGKVNLAFFLPIEHNPHVGLRLWCTTEALYRCIDARERMKRKASGRTNSKWGLLLALVFLVAILVRKDEGHLAETCKDLKKKGEKGERCSANTKTGQSCHRCHFWQSVSSLTSACTSVSLNYHFHCNSL